MKRKLINLISIILIIAFACHDLALGSTKGAAALTAVRVDLRPLSPSQSLGQGEWLRPQPAGERVAKLIHASLCAKVGPVEDFRIMDEKIYLGNTIGRVYRISYFKDGRRCEDIAWQPHVPSDTPRFCIGLQEIVEANAETIRGAYEYLAVPYLLVIYPHRNITRTVTIGLKSVCRMQYLYLFDEDSREFLPLNPELFGLLIDEIARAPADRVEMKLNDTGIRELPIPKAADASFWHNWQADIEFEHQIYRKKIDPFCVDQLQPYLARAQSIFGRVVLLDIFAGGGDFIGMVHRRASPSIDFKAYLIERDETNVANARSRLAGYGATVIQAELGNGKTDLAQLCPEPPHIITSIGGINTLVLNNRGEALRVARQAYDVLPEGGIFVVSGWSLCFLDKDDFENIRGRNRGFKVMQMVAPAEVLEGVIPQFYVLVKPFIIAAQGLAEGAGLLQAAAAANGCVLRPRAVDERPNTATAHATTEGPNSEPARAAGERPKTVQPDIPPTPFTELLYEILDPEAERQHSIEGWVDLMDRLAEFTRPGKHRYAATELELKAYQLTQQTLVHACTTLGKARQELATKRGYRDPKAAKAAVSFACCDLASTMLRTLEGLRNDDGSAVILETNFIEDTLSWEEFLLAVWKVYNYHCHETRYRLMPDWDIVGFRNKAEYDAKDLNAPIAVKAIVAARCTGAEPYIRSFPDLAYQFIAGEITMVGYIEPIDNRPPGLVIHFKEPIRDSKGERGVKSVSVFLLKEAWPPVSTSSPENELQCVEFDESAVKALVFPEGSPSAEQAERVEKLFNLAVDNRLAARCGYRIQSPEGAQRAAEFYGRTPAEVKAIYWQAVTQLGYGFYRLKALPSSQQPLKADAETKRALIKRFTRERKQAAQKGKQLAQDRAEKARAQSISEAGELLKDARELCAVVSHDDIDLIRDILDRGSRLISGLDAAKDDGLVKGIEEACAKLVRNFAESVVRHIEAIDHKREQDPNAEELLKQTTDIAASFPQALQLLRDFDKIKHMLPEQLKAQELLTAQRFAVVRGDKQNRHMIEFLGAVCQIRPYQGDASRIQRAAVSLGGKTDQNGREFYNGVKQLAAWWLGKGMALSAANEQALMSVLRPLASDEGRPRMTKEVQGEITFRKKTLTREATQARKRRELVKARELLFTALRLDGNDAFTLLELAKLYLAFGDYHKNPKLYGTALMWVDRALLVPGNQDDIDALILKINILLAYQRPFEAVKVCDDTFAMGFDLSGVYSLKIKALRMLGRSRLHEAEAICAEARGKYPNDIVLKTQHAQLMMDDMRYEAAIPILEEVLSMRPYGEMAKAMLRKAQTLAKGGTGHAAAAALGCVLRVRAASERVEGGGEILLDEKFYFTPAPAVREATVTRVMNKIGALMDTIKNPLVHISRLGGDVFYIDIGSGKSEEEKENGYTLSLLEVFNNAVDSVGIKWDALGRKHYRGLISLRITRIGNSLIIECEDNGTGIEKRIIEKLFRGRIASGKANHPDRKGLRGKIGEAVFNHYGRLWVASIAGNIEIDSCDPSSEAYRVTYFSDSYVRIEKSNKPDQGTSVRFTLPGFFTGLQHQPENFNRARISKGGKRGMVLKPKPDLSLGQI